MHNNFFKRFSSVIREDITGPDDRLLLDRDGALSIYYAPFDYVNKSARLVVVGITPGKTQMMNAIAEARHQLESGADTLTALRLAKRTGSFSGTMKPNSVNLLDNIGIHQWLSLRSCDVLFADANDLVHTTSALRYPVFVDGANYNGTPNMLKHPLLKRHLVEYFGSEVRQLRDALFVPLGDKVAEALQFLVGLGMIDSHRVLDGLPHPSGANAERVAYFLGNKARERLSAKTDSRKIDKAKTTLLSKMENLRKAA